MKLLSNRIAAGDRRAEGAAPRNGVPEKSPPSLASPAWGVLNRPAQWLLALPTAFSVGQMECPSTDATNMFRNPAYSEQANVRHLLQPSQPALPLG